MNYKYHRKNSKVIALIIEASLLFLGFIVLFILDSSGVALPFIPIIIVTCILIFSLMLTLSLIRYDSLRRIRKEFKESNLPLYTDSTTLQGHDIKDEEEN